MHVEGNNIYIMDCVDGLSNLSDNTAQIVIADPPYNIGKNFGNNLDNRTLENYLEWCDIWIEECMRVLMNNGTIFIYGFSEILAHIAVRIPMNIRWLIWHYTNKNVPSLNFWQRSHEAILCCWGEERVFHRDDVREPYTEGFLNGAAGKKRASTKGRLGSKETVYTAHSGGALPRDVIKIPALAGGAGMSERWFICHTCDRAYEPRYLKEHKEHDVEKHPTQKPLELCDRLIMSCRQENGLVVIPFVGSGSECVSAKRLGVPYIGFDLNPDYIRLSEARLKTVDNNLETV